MIWLTRDHNRSAELWLPFLVTGILALAGCGGSSTHSPSSSSSPPSAMALAQKVPGTSGCQTQTPDVEVTQDVICQFANGSQLEIATFASGADETQWIQNGGSGSPPDPSYAGCCVEGALWAATIGGPDYAGSSGASPVISAVGGRVVNG
jgi:hypothetical protein